MSIDDLLLIAHHELLRNPTIVSWTVTCEFCGSTNPERVHYAHCTRPRDERAKQT